MKKLFTLSLYVFAGGTLGVFLLGVPHQRAGAHAASPKGKSRVQELEGQLALAEAELATCKTDLDVAIAAQSELAAQVYSLQAELETTRALLAESQATLAETQDLLDKCIKRSKLSVLPDTGQTTCYDENGFEIACDSATCPGQDAFYTGCPNEGRFVDHGDGTVTDTCTGLMWQKDTADTNGDGVIDFKDEGPWCDALAYSENLTLGGHDDWRLPNVRELQSIVDYGRIVPSIDPVFGATGALYRSSSSFTLPRASRWFVDFGFGGVYSTRDLSGYVRAVRNAP